MSKDAALSRDDGSEDLMARVPSGGYLVMYEGVDTDPAQAEALRQYNESGAIPYRLRQRPGLIIDAGRAGGTDVTVYVYKLAGQRGKFWTQEYPFPWYGLTADTEEELHYFAESIGMYRHFYRPVMSGDKQLPMAGHYDLDQGERDQAVASGAKPITTREHKKMRDQRAAELGIKLK